MQRYFFPKTKRLLHSREFRTCAKFGTERSGRYLHIHICPSSFPETKLGLTVSRRYGKAVMRNRFKRLMREAFRLSQHKLPQSIHLNVRPHKDCQHVNLSELQEELLSLSDCRNTESIT